MDLPQHLRSRTSLRSNVRLWVGLAIMMAGAWALTSQFWTYAQNHPVVFQALPGEPLHGMTPLAGLPKGFVPQDYAPR